VNGRDEALPTCDHIVPKKQHVPDKVEKEFAS
jgi:hypothetical protein